MSLVGKSISVRNPSAHRAGFTLLEIVVAAAITGAIVAALLGLVVTTLAQWNRTQGRLAAEMQAETVLDYVAQDLQGALPPRSGRVGFAATVETGEGPSGAWTGAANPKPGSLALAPASDDLRDARFGRAGVWLRCFTHRMGSDPAAADLANPVAISYQVIRRPLAAGGAASRYFLYRAETTPLATMDAGLDLAAAVYAEPSSSFGAAGNVTSPVARQVIAENVIDFGVRFYAWGHDPATGRLNLSRLFPRAEDDLEYTAGGPSAAGEPRPFPNMAEVMVRILTEEGAQKIAALESNATDGDWWTMAEAHSYVVTRRILLPAEGS